MPVVYRPLRDADFDALADMLTEAHVADGQPIRRVGAEIREEFESLPVDVAAHTFSAWDGDQMVGAAYAYHVRSEEAQESCYVFGAVRPSYRGRGVGRRLLHDGLVTAQRLLDESPSRAPRVVKVVASHSNLPAMHLFERAGLTPVRHFTDLRRALDSVPERPEASGFSVIPWDLARNDEVRVVKNLAFRDHWGSSPTSEELWKARTTGFGSRVDLSYFAVNADDGIVGYLLSHRFDEDDSLLGAKYAWIDNIGTLAEWRGRGVATQLLITALTAYRDAGLEFAALDVDSESPTGAHRLYESLGFRPWRRTVMYQRELGASR